MAEGSGQGMVYTANTAKQQLLESNRDYNNRLTWQNLYNQNAVAAQRAENQLVKQYTDASTAAYVSYLQNQNAIRNSNIVGSGQQSLLQQNRSALDEAYNSYRNSLLEGTTAIAESAAEGEAAITSALEEQAQYTADYTNAHYSYLEELYNRYLNGENQLFNEDSQWYKYTTLDPLLDENNNVVLDENGNIVYDETSRRLKTTDELFAPSFEQVTDENGNTVKEWTSLYDDQGNLTLAGVDFFDQIENQLANEGGYSWGDYLSETNPELYDWATTYNPYNYTQEGTNAGTMRTMYGMMSTDYTYEFAERFGGLTTSQINDMYSEYETAIDNLSAEISSSGKDKGKEQIQGVKDLVSSIKTMAIDLGIDQDIEKELGMSFEELETAVQQYYNASMTSGEMAGSWFGTVGTDVAAFAGAGAAGGAIGAALGGGITAGAGAAIGSVGGAVIGFITGVVTASQQVDAQRNANKLNAEQAEKLFNQLLVTMTNYSASKKRQAEIDFNTSAIY